MSFYVFLLRGKWVDCGLEVIMYKGKEAGWTGAFGLICGLITCVWIYTAVLAFM